MNKHRSPTTSEVIDLLTEAQEYVEVRRSIGAPPDPLCPRLVALRDALNLLPAVDPIDEHHFRLLAARNQRKRADLRIVTVGDPE